MQRHGRENPVSGLQLPAYFIVYHSKRLSLSALKTGDSRCESGISYFQDTYRAKSIPDSRIGGDS
jgi:hypothetical protein